MSGIDGVDRRVLMLRNRRRWADLLFVVLLTVLAGLLGWLSERHAQQFDWTAAQQHTLSESSRRLLAAFEGPLVAVAYTRPESDIAAQIRVLIDRYRRVKPDMALRFVNPDLAPTEVRDLEIRFDGEILFEYAGRQERLEKLSEQTLTNLLQRLLRTGERHVRFVAGHGERKPLGEANHDLGRFGVELQRKGLKIEAMNPVLAGGVATDTALLVVAGPRSPLLPGESELIAEYIDRGGNLLWLADPDSTHGGPLLEAVLGVRLHQGTAVSASGAQYGVGDPSFVVVSDYPEHPVTQGLTDVTLLPRAAALEILAESAANGWQSAPLLRTADRSWTEYGPIDGTVRHDPDSGELSGPLDLAVALTRPTGDGGEQRVAIVGDGDFLANAYLGNGGNLDFSLRLFNWLVADDRLVSVPPRTATDRMLSLSWVATLAIGAGLLFVLPLGFLSTGLAIWWRRRRR